jgi:tetratricopeptide (TPR) repeat protein
VKVCYPSRMLDPDDAKRALDHAMAQSDPDALDAARAAYLDAVRSGPEAAEVRYRLGLSRLFRHQDVAGAIELLKDAAAEKGAPIAPEARVSLAICLAHHGKRQQALFELRRMVPEGAPPTVHTVQALDFLSTLLRQSGAAMKDVLAADELRKKHLQAMVSSASDKSERAHYLLRLAAAHGDSATGPELAAARKRYEEVIAMGAAAGDSAVAAARAAMKSLPRG